MSTSALASLTAQYTDSENEDNRDDDSNDSHGSQVIIPRPKSPPPPKRLAEKSPTEIKSPKRKKRSKKLRRLVSYKDDTIISDEEEVEETDSSDSSEETASKSSGDESDSNSSEVPHKKSGERNATKSSPQIDKEDNFGTENGNSPQPPQSPSKNEKYSHYGFNLPPEPKGKPSTEVIEKIKQLYEKMQSNNMDMNAIIQRRKEFRNPSIYKKLIEFCDINEFGTNYPPEIYDPLRWGAESYYEELARVQKNEMMKRQKERKETDKIEQATALARKVEEEAKKRKSKWDQPAKTIAPPTLTTTVTGTKGTVISAFGSLPKKPAA